LPGAAGGRVLGRPAAVPPRSRRQRSLDLATLAACRPRALPDRSPGCAPRAARRARLPRPGPDAVSGPGQGHGGGSSGCVAHTWS